MSNSLSDTSECFQQNHKYSDHLRGFDEPEYDGVYPLQYKTFGLENLLLINNRPIYQKIYSGNSKKPDNKCIWWDKSRHWFLGLCEDLGTDKALVLIISFSFNSLHMFLLKLII